MDKGGKQLNEKGKMVNQNCLLLPLKINNIVLFSFGLENPFFLIDCI